MENQPARECVIPLHKPSRKELLFFLVSGSVVSFPFGYFFESLFPIQFSVAFALVVLGPFVEELAKVFPLFYRHGETERSFVTLGLLIGLGFGIVEFFEYVLLGGYSVISSTSHIIFHASSATITAYGVAKKNPVPYFLIAVSLHITNNFVIFTPDILAVFVQLLVLITVYLLAWRFYHQASPKKIVV